jgi:hypothetical protein
MRVLTLIIVLAFARIIDKLPGITPSAPHHVQIGSAKMRNIRTLLAASLSVSILSVTMMWPQAQPKPAPASSPQATAPATSSGACHADYYRNSNGVCVHRPVKSHGSAAPQGATAQCRDGSYSFSQHRRGTCSHHGGVAKWL